MNTEMTELEILDAYQAMDFARLTLYLMGRVAFCDNTEEAVTKELDAFMNLIHGHELDWCFVVDPISVLSLVEHCMTLVNENKLPGNLLVQDEIVARNLIFADGVFPFLKTLSDAIMDSLSGRPVMNTWKDETVSGMLIEQEKFFSSGNKYTVGLSRRSTNLLADRLKNNPSDGSIIRILLCMEAIGELSPAFCRERWIALDAAIKQARNECDTCPERDTFQDEQNKHRPTDAHLDGAGYPGAVGFSVN